MRLLITNRRRFILHASVVALLLVALRTPTVQRVVAGGLIEFAELTERIVRFPCWAVDNSRCFSLDRLDPTCPQCL